MPLHPLIVHFPIAIGCILPLLIVTNIALIHKYKWPDKTWWFTVAFQAILFFSSLAAIMSGEHDEENGTAPLVSGIHDHEEWGEKVVVLAVIALIISVMPFLQHKKSKAWMWGTFLLSVLILALLVVTGHTGGKLIYPLH